VTPNLNALTRLFYSEQERLGQFEEVSPADIPAYYGNLLAHENHMTVTVEKFHGSPVDVRVLETQLTGRHYARKILLTRQSDGGVVQFGIMRLNFALVDEKVQREVESQATPLGRILINNKVLREVHLFKLWKVTPGEELRNLFGMQSGQVTYGRTAIIDCNGEPAVELLEIVTPE
jgi:chorismate-pyruvate lyase